MTVKDHLMVINTCIWGLKLVVLLIIWLDQIFV